MLSTEYSIQINGITLFRDHVDERKYYYLPKGDIRIAGNGKKLNYFAYVDSSMDDSLEPQGGFLTFEVELGPSDKELEDLKTILSADDFVLVPVPFKDGDVKLCVFGEDGSVENPLSQVKIVGSQKPSLFGKQTAVFSVHLTDKDADIMYQMLTICKKENDDETSVENGDNYINSHIAVFYDLTYKGISPAHYVKITIDFQAVEDYWNHHVDAKVNLNLAKTKNPKIGKETDTSKFSIPIVLSANLDIVLRDLINEGAIIVQQIDYTGNDVGSPLEGDPSAIKLVKELMSAELFEATAVPQEKSGVAKEVVSTVGSASEAMGIVAGTVAGIKTNEKKTDGKNAVAAKIDKKNAVAGTTDDKNAVAAKTDDKNAVAAKTDGKNAVAAKTDGKNAVAVKTDDKNAVAAKTDDKNAVAGKADDKNTVAGKADDQVTDKVETPSYPAFKDISNKKHKISWADWIKIDKLPKDAKSKAFFDKYAVVEDDISYEEWKKVRNDENRWEQKSFVSETKYNEYRMKLSNEAKPVPPEFAVVAGEDGKISREEWEKFVKDKDGFDKHAAIGIKLKHAEWIGKLNESEEFWESNSFIGEKEYEELLKAETGGKSKDSDEKNSTKTEGVSSTVSTVEWSLGVNVGYTLKRRKTDEKVKRTYVFNKQTAVDYIIHPSGILTVDGTEFDVDKQVSVGRLGKGPFRNHEIYFGSALDFDAYHLEKILINVDHIDSTGTVIELTKDKTSDTIHFISERFNIAADNEDEQTEEAKQNAYAAGDKLSYRVSFFFKSSTIKGYDNEGLVRIETAKKYTSSKVIMIGPEDIKMVYALDIQTGNLTLGRNIKSATLSLFEVENAECNIYSQKLSSDTDKIILLNPDKKYKARVQYNLESTFDNIAVTKKEFSYTTNVLTAKELVIQDPTAGMVKITPSDGDETFEEVKSITVKLRKGDESPSTIQLTKAKSECYYVTDYTEGAPEKVLVESIKVKYRDKDMDPEEYTSEDLDVDEFSTDETDYVLDI